MKLISLLLLIIFSIGCSNYGPSMPLSDEITPPTKKQPLPDEGDAPVEEMITYAKDIRPLFKEQCSICHNKDSGLPNVMDYDFMLGYLDRTYKAVVVDKRMPMPPKSLTDEERELVRLWIERGAPLNEDSPLVDTSEIL